MDKLRFTMTTSISKREACAWYEGELFFRMEALVPTNGLLLLQSRLAVYHPARDVEYEGLLYLDRDEEGYFFARAKSESEIPVGHTLYRGWHLNRFFSRDQERGITPV